MKHLKNYLKLLASHEYRREKGLSVGEVFLFLFLAIIAFCLLVTRIGTKILSVLAILVTFVMLLLLMWMAILNIYRIIKDFQKVKKQWEMNTFETEVINEEGVTGEEENSEKKQENCTYAPTYFLDLSALEYFSGAFYSSFLTECFDWTPVAPEANAILMTDEKTLQDLKVKEDDREEKKIYLGYTAFIRRHFQVLQPLENFEQDLTKVVETQVPYFIYVTADEEKAKELTQNIPIQVKLLAKKS